MNHKRKPNGRGHLNAAPTRHIDLRRLLRDTIRSRQPEASEALIEDFSRWAVDDMWKRYNEHRKIQQRTATLKMNDIPSNIPNGSQSQPYCSPTIELPQEGVYGYEIEGLDDTGLMAVFADDNHCFNIQGIPTIAGDITLKLKFRYDGWLEGDPLLEHEIRFTINPDPRSLWKSIPSSPDICFPKPDVASEYVKVEADADGNPCKDIVAASQRGRSHAREGKPRDDHFEVAYDKASGWYILAVADGAGSARYSRKGSEVACKTVMNECSVRLADNADFEAAIAQYNDAKLLGEDAEKAARKQLGDFVYHIIGNAAHKAHKAIVEAVKTNEGSQLRDFHTTLMFAICKKFSFGWFIASFWVGDGAIAIYDEKAQSVSLLGTPDEGEFSGQTRFLTMPEIFQDAALLYKRFRFEIRDDFTALMLMTDGVSDAMFATDSNLNNVERWNRFWKTLHDGFPDDRIPGVDLSDDNAAAKNQLLEWLNFWIKGEHDDRTLAILY